MRFRYRRRAWCPLRSRRRELSYAALLSLLCCTGCFHDAALPILTDEPVPALRYTAIVEGAPSAELADLAERALLTYRMQDRGARNRVSLRRRVAHDELRLAELLRSRGYFGSQVASDVDFAADDLARVRFLVHAGPAYTLIEHGLVLDTVTSADLPELDAGALGSPVGAAADAAEIVRAEEAAVTALHAEGFPYAAHLEREGIADPDTATVTVTSTIAVGPFAVFGPLRFAGLETVREPYLSTYWSWDEGAPFDRAVLGTFQRRLMATDLFRSVSVRIPDEAPSGRESPLSLPVVVSVEEGPRRRVEAGARYDTDFGPAVRAGWLHRNLFGANESVRVQAEIGRVQQDVTVDGRKPQYRRSGQVLAGQLRAGRTDDHALAARTATGSIGLTRELTQAWTVGLRGLVEFSAIDEPGGTVNAYLAGAPASATYNRTDRPLDPTMGLRLEFEAIPFAGRLADAQTRFGTLVARGSIYRPLDDDAHIVAAVRARAGMVFSRDFDSVPATRRLYAGGGGSVRGYAKASIGPLAPDGTPSGGRSVLEAEAELRIRVSEDFGVVPFLAAGLVSADTVPDGTEPVRAAAGLGVRYFSRAGPIRLDLAVPLDAQPIDDPWAVYFSIGQAF